ncbi:hypothetical protein ACQ3G4_22445 [bacterium BS0013]
MALDLYIGGVCIGSVVRGFKGVFAYGPDGSAFGQFHDTDAAARALASRAGIKDGADAA